MARDRISNLPRHIVDHILKCLPLRDAVRTSILSKEWRFKWVSIPHLVFDWDFKLSLRQNCPPEYIISHMLLLHEGPIVKFSISNIVDGHLAVNDWVHILSSCWIEDLTLRLTPSSTLYVIPPHVFSFDHLTRLWLEHVDFKLPPTFKGFSGLVKLILINVHIALDELQRFISECSILEYLCFCMCNDPHTFWCLNIDAPKLKFLYLTGLFNSICLKTPSVEKILLEYGGSVLLSGGWNEDFELPESNGGGSNLIKFFGELPFLKKLEVGLFFLQFLAIGGVPQELPNKLNHLIDLKLDYINFGILDNVTCALCVIRSSPNLQSLRIKFETYNPDTWPPMSDSMKDEQKCEAVKYLKAEQKCEILLSHLKTVRIDTFSGYETEFEFVKLLLLWGALLGRLEVCSPSETEEESLAMVESEWFHQPSPPQPVVSLILS